MTRTLKAIVAALGFISVLGFASQGHAQSVDGIVKHLLALAKQENQREREESDAAFDAMRTPLLPRENKEADSLKAELYEAYHKGTIFDGHVEMELLTIVDEIQRQNLGEQKLSLQLIQLELKNCQRALGQQNPQ